MSKNYYDETIEKTKELISEEKYEEADILLNTELAMPYIPRIYEEIFIDLKNEIKSATMDETFTKTVPIDVALEYLVSGDINNESIALELLRDHNLRNHIDILKKVIESWGVEKNMLKAYLFELLIEQEINIDINLNGMLMNPSKTKTILENESVINVIQLIEESLKKNPSTLNLALDEFQRFLLVTYPMVPNEAKAMSDDIIAVVQKMFDDKTILTERQKKIKEILS
ncbi:MAG: DUF3196 family protein [Mycoplasmataceae bacterium]|nr:DUF3196 family protein [Mycoplasmataceae bacterium]